MTRLSVSNENVRQIIDRSNLSSSSSIKDLISETHRRRTMDLSDLSPSSQAAIINCRLQSIQPSVESLAERITIAKHNGRPFIAKFGIDPTGADVHLGHSVPMQILSRIQRMGHQIVFIVGDMTAQIGDPSGRSDERPLLTSHDIENNLATYRSQVSPFFDFNRAQFRRNSEWLKKVPLDRLLSVMSKIPVAMPMQREDFRKRMEAGQGLAMSELMYSIVMALDSVEVCCDLEIGGIDQFLNMQMCRKVMEICNQTPEIVVATSLIEGTDGSGAKMSKSKGNYVPLNAPAGEIFGKIMSIPDKLMKSYLAALTEWLDDEIELVWNKIKEGSIHPMDLKKILACEVVSSIHGPVIALSAKTDFDDHFSNKDYTQVGDLPVIYDHAARVVDTIRNLGFTKSNSDSRRLTLQKAIRIIIYSNTYQKEIILDINSLNKTIHELMSENPGEIFIKVGRRVARVSVAPSS